jgi:DNA-binding response OmpR family regulator
MEKEKTILLVDDDPDILMVLKGNLELSGYHVLTASCAKEALDICKQDEPELVVLDLVLPDMDGIQVCCRIREMNESLPIIMLTARDGVTDKVLGFECGADDYVVKPFDFLELQARIKTCLRRQEKRGEKLPQRLERGPLVIDHSTYRVWRDDNPVELTKKEFDLLYFLASHPEQVLSREEIRHALWGKRQLYTWSRTIDVHIQHLRQKIERDPKKPELILTVPGVGYRLAV